MAGTIVREPDAPFIRLAGEFDLTSAEELRDAIVGARDGGAQLRIEMSGVVFIDSAGLHAIVDGARAVGGAEPTVLIDPPSRIVRTMEILGIVRMPEIEIQGRSDV